MPQCLRLIKILAKGGSVPGPIECVRCYCSISFMADIAMQVPRLSFTQTVSQQSVLGWAHECKIISDSPADNLNLPCFLTSWAIVNATVPQPISLDQQPRRANFHQQPTSDKQG